MLRGVRKPDEEDSNNDTRNRRQQLHNFQEFEKERDHQTKPKDQEKMPDDDWRHIISSSRNLDAAGILIRQSGSPDQRNVYIGCRSFGCGDFYERVQLIY